MKKHVVVLGSAETAPTIELIESLANAGIAVRIEDLGVEDEPALFCSGEATPGDPLAIVYELNRRASVEELRSVLEFSARKWPTSPIVACRRSSDKSASHESPLLQNSTLKQLGVRAVADRPAQLSALLRQVEEGPGTGELRLPPEFKSPLDSEAFALPASVRGENLRGALATLASLHLASNQKQAGQAALAGIARLVAARRWSIFVCTQTDANGPLSFEPLVVRTVIEDECLRFDDAWRRELLNEPAASTERASKSAHAAATRIETIKRTEDRRRVIALPLVGGERVIGVLEGIRSGVRARQFSASEGSLLAALAIPIASALANSVRIAEAERLSLTDDLTKLHNARYLRQFLVNEIKRARRYGSSVAAVFLDLDDFKLVNDQHGHLVGSHALMEVASVILPSVRDTDCVVRYGGDEFVMILPETGADEAVQVANRIREKIERHRFTGGRGLRVSLTASFGVAVFPQHAMSPHQLIACADTAMYGAKAAHKNCVRVASESQSTVAADTQLQTLPDSSQFQRFPDDKLIS